MGRLYWKKSFTILEIVVVIVVVGILAAVVLPRMEPERLRDGANVVVNALRYTQHLAMVDDKYVPTPTLSRYSNPTQQEKDVKQWFKKWWCFYIWDLEGDSSSPYGEGPAIAIFSDHPSSNDNNLYNNNPEYEEMARDPVSGKLYTGHEFDSSFEDEIEEKYNLRRYGIQKVVVESPCKSSKVVFDEIGRPHCQQTTSSDNLVPYNRILRERVIYTLCADGECEKNISVCLHPMSGVVEICS